MTLPCKRCGKDTLTRKGANPKYILCGDCYQELLNTNPDFHDSEGAKYASYPKTK